MLYDVKHAHTAIQETIWFSPGTIRSAQELPVFQLSFAAVTRSSEAVLLHLSAHNLDSRLCLHDQSYRITMQIKYRPYEPKVTQNSTKCVRTGSLGSMRPAAHEAAYNDRCSKVAIVPSEVFAQTLLTNSEGRSYSQRSSEYKSRQFDTHVNLQVQDRSELHQNVLG